MAADQCIGLLLDTVPIQDRPAILCRVCNADGFISFTTRDGLEVDTFILGIEKEVAACAEAIRRTAETGYQNDQES